MLFFSQVSTCTVRFLWGFKHTATRTSSSRRYRWLTFPHTLATPTTCWTASWVLFQQPTASPVRIHKQACPTSSTEIKGLHHPTHSASLINKSDEATRRNFYSLPFVKKRLNPRLCFSGNWWLANEEDEEDLERCFGRLEFFGEGKGLPSASEGVMCVLNLLTGDSFPAPRISWSVSGWPAGFWEDSPAVVPTASCRKSSIRCRLGEQPKDSAEGRIACSWRPRISIVSWHSASFSAAAAISFSCHHLNTKIRC